MVPLVRLVLWAHDKFIFDPDQTGAFAGRRTPPAKRKRPRKRAISGSAMPRRSSSTTLVRRPTPLTIRGGLGGTRRRATARTPDAAACGPDAPSHPFLRVLTVGDDDDDTGDDDKRVTGTPWTMEARQRVRAYHLLMRWSTAVSDPRHALVAPDAPAVNYQILLGVVLLAWVHKALEFKQLRSCSSSSSTPSSGGATARGTSAGSTRSSEPRCRAHRSGLRRDRRWPRMPRDRVPGWQDDIYDWQPALQRGIEHGVLLPGPLSASVIEHLTGDTVTVPEVEELLINRTGWVDDATWCKRLAAELGLDFIALDRFSPPAVPIVARVRESPDPLHDNRLLTIARRVVDFKRVHAVAVRSGQATFVFEPGKYARALVDGQTYQTTKPVVVAQIKEVEAQEGVGGRSRRSRAAGRGVTRIKDAAAGHPIGAFIYASSPGRDAPLLCRGDRPGRHGGNRDRANALCLRAGTTLSPTPAPLLVSVESAREHQVRPRASQRSTI